MCDQTPFEYHDGDVVWVKLGVCWWPGEVTDFDSLPKEVTQDFRKRPLATVKFFQEDSYEYVKNINQIYTYNCKKKNDFIKKGLDLFKAKNTFMEKFPDDVRTAEEKTGGDPGIVQEVLTEGDTRVKPSDFFTPPRKVKDRRSKATPGTSTPRSVTSDEDNFQVRVLVQKSDTPSTLRDRGKYSCTTCGFQTSSVEVIIVHNKSHIQGVYNSRTFAAKRPKKSPKKPKRTYKMAHSKTTNIDEDLALASKGVILYGESSEEELVDLDLDEPEPKKKRRSYKRKQKKKPVKKKPETKEEKVDFCQTILADWEECDAEDEGNSITSLPEEKSENSAEKPTDKSCFDFEEEEESVVSSATVGRKIPRVIPPTEKRNSLEESPKKALEEETNEIDAELDSFKQALESTSVPELPTIPDLPKEISAEKPEETDSPKKTQDEKKLINPKKRFVKSFEDFENQYNQQVVEEPKETTSTLKVSKLKTQLMSKLENAEEFSPESPRSTRSGGRQSKSRSKSQDEEEIPTELKPNLLQSPKRSKTEDHVTEEIVTPRVLRARTSQERIITPGKPTRTSTTSDEDEKLKTKLDQDSKVIDSPVGRRGRRKKRESVEETKEENKEEEIVPKRSRRLSQKEEEETIAGMPVTADSEEFDVVEEAKPTRTRKSRSSIEEEKPDDVIETPPEKPEEEKPEEKVEEVKVEETPPIVENPPVVENVVAENPSTDLSNLDQLTEQGDLSALSTLAAVSEMSDNLDVPVEKTPTPTPTPTQSQTPKVAEGNLTIVTDLEDTQVEIANVIDDIEPKVKPITLTNFSVDFSDYKNDDNKLEEMEIEKCVPIEHIEETKIERPTKTHAERKAFPDLNGDNLQTKTKEVTVIPKSPAKYASTSKLLNILTDGKETLQREPMKTKLITKPPKTFNKIDPKGKIVIKSPAMKVTPSKSNKPIILSERIIKPMVETISVQKVTTKTTLQQDIEDIDTFIIHKTKKAEIEEIQPKPLPLPLPAKSRGKAKILQQTIITPSGGVIQAGTSQTDMFDISSMPIVLGDQILTPESIENMPVVLSDSLPTASTSKPISVQPISKPREKLLTKTTVIPSTQVKTYVTTKPVKSPRILTSGTKLMKASPHAPLVGKQGKYIVVPSSAPTGNKYSVGKKPPIAKHTSPVAVNKVDTEPSGNKIMIVTNQQGQQSRVLLTPAQQKMLGYQTSGKMVKTQLKGNILQRASPKLNTTAVQAKPISHAVVNSKGEIISTSSNLVIADGQVLMSVKAPMRTFKQETTNRGKKLQKVVIDPKVKPQQKTIVIKNQQGQIVKKIQGNDDALLEKKVAEQVQAIKASGSFSGMKSKPEVVSPKPKPTSRRPPFNKHKPEVKTPSRPNVLNTTTTTTTTPKTHKVEGNVPPLTPLTSKKTEVEKVEEKPKTESKPLNQLIIQDALGNQTTITEGQILALPSETIDGQPQSYMLVTLDESGNLAPLNNEALLSLDPNLCLGGDLSNMVLQIDGGKDAVKEGEVGVNPVAEVTPTVTEAPAPTPTPTPAPAPVLEPIETAAEEVKAETTVPTTQTDPPLDNVQSVACNLGTDPNQHLIITGDPIYTQKFIESLADGNPDLANLLAGAEGNILIHADGHQILINTDPDNQIVLPNTTDEAEGNPIFASGKNQDILAAALADTDVFQQDQTNSKLTQLSPNSSLYPNNVNNDLDTTFSLSSPITTPLEVPTSNKKVQQEDDFNEVPKSVVLPITITDPNISQAVPQSVPLIGGELTELPLAIPEPTVTSTEMNSPSFVYSLPSLDESDQKSFSGPISMPLLTEEPQQESVVSTVEEKTESVINSLPLISSERSNLFENSSDSIKDTDEEPQGLCTLGGEICSSLSEPPHDMFDLSVHPNYNESIKSTNYNISETKTDSSDSFSCPPSVETTNDRAQASTDSSPKLVVFEEGTDAAHIPETKVKVGEVEAPPTSDTDKTDGDESRNNTPSSQVDSSPMVNIDENSCEIPVQSQIVTDLSSSSFDASNSADSFRQSFMDENNDADRKKTFD